MLSISLLVIIIILMPYMALLMRSFAYMSISELKRQARRGDVNAKLVYNVRIYGLKLWLLLWLTQAILIVSAIFLLQHVLGISWSFVIALFMIIILQVIIPHLKQPRPSLSLAASVSRYIETILRLTFPILNLLTTTADRYLQAEQPVMIQSREEFLEVLKYNAGFNHISRTELAVAKNALLFGDKLIVDYMTPLSTVYFISHEEHLTPVVMADLYDSGHTRFPVYSGSHQNVVGTLYLHDAVNIKRIQTVADIMQSAVYYINEQQNLNYALSAFIKTKHHLLMVVNEFAEIVGTLSIEAILQQIIGEPLVDEFSDFNDLQTVARQTPNQKQTTKQIENT